MVMAVMLPVALLAVFDHSFSVVSERGSLWIEPTADPSLRAPLHIRGANSPAREARSLDLSLKIMDAYMLF